MSILALVVWGFTAAAGVFLVMAVIAAKRGAVTATRGKPVTAAPAGPVTATPGKPVTAAPAATSGRPAVPPPIPHTRVTAGPGEHPLREFSHPALGITGLACWLAFVATHYQGFAWVASAMLIITVAAGLAWLASNARRAGRAGPAGIPKRLMFLQGLAAAVSSALVVASVLAAVHA